MKKILAFAMALCLTLTGVVFAADGVYSATANGNNGEITVEVVIKDGRIEGVAPVTHSETAGLGDVAMKMLAGQIVEGQTVKLDAVTGATNSSNALIAAVKQAISDAGLNVEDFMKDVAGESAAATDIDCDLVIVGAGGAGMVAALQAAQDGVSQIVIVEKMATSGGNTVRSTGGMNATGTPEQAKNEFAEGAGVEKTLASAKANYGEALADLIATVETQWAAYQANPQGYFDSVELFMLDTLVGGKNLNDPALVRELAENSADGIAWLQELGADLSSVGAFGGASVKRIHRPVNAEGKTVAVGSYLAPILTDKCAQNEHITILYETKATEILMENGAASGVRVEGKGGAYSIFADAVILATGGFGANEEMYTSYKPELKGFVSTNAPGATGDGIAMATAIGAATVDMEQIQIHPTVEQATSALITEGLRGDGAIMVNQEGMRFCDEVGTRDVVSAAVIAQTGSYAYLIVDQAMVDASSVIAGYIKKGYTVEGEDAAALAQAIGSDPAALTATMDAWNACVEAGADAEFGRTSFVKKLDTAPLYAIKIAPGVHHTMGGLKIDTHTCVLGEDGAEIPGLYAAGEVTGGVHGANRLGGNAVADIVVMGRVAGQSAAEYCEAFVMDEAA